MSIKPKFIESICYQRGDYQLIECHQSRVNRTFKQFFPNKKPLELKEILPQLNVKERYKVRIVYSDDILDIQYEQYIKRPISSFKIAINDQINYSFKYEDRDPLKKLFDHRGESDDIIIVKNNQITDSYYANLAFFDGQKWVTPTTSLLDGVKKQSLLDKNLLFEAPISLEDLNRFQFISPINAMLELAEIKVPISNIKLL